MKLIVSNDVYDKVDVPEELKTLIELESSETGDNVVNVNKLLVKTVLKELLDVFDASNVDDDEKEEAKNVINALFAAIHPVAETT